MTNEKMELVKDKIVGSEPVPKYILVGEDKIPVKLDNVNAIVESTYSDGKNEKVVKEVKPFVVNDIETDMEKVEVTKAVFDKAQVAYNKLLEKKAKEKSAKRVKEFNDKKVKNLVASGMPEKQAKAFVA